MTEEETVIAVAERMRRQSRPYPRIATITEAELLRGYGPDDRDTVLRELGLSQ
ncbi:MAG: hypothetical protein KA756_14445 [Steroidobacteraceae bacterium]|nr:hypothetical protein [Steroidobacteraceae bacterium]